MKYLIFLFNLLLLLCSGCVAPKPSCSNTWMCDNGKIKILATTAMIADIARKVGGSEVDVLVLIPPALDPHSYELVKGDDEKFYRADLIFYNGLGLEHGMSLRRMLHKNPKSCCVTTTLSEAHPELILEVDGLVDPHIWMDISLWMHTLEPIFEALCQMKPAATSQFRENYEHLRHSLGHADLVAYETLQKVPSQKRYLVTSHDAFHYFTRRYLSDPEEEEWQTRCRAPEGLAPDAELGMADLAEVLNYIIENKTHVLFAESNINKQSIVKLMQAGVKKGHPIRLSNAPLYSDSMGDLSSYVEMIMHNVNVIAKELCQE